MRLTRGSGSIIDESLWRRIEFHARVRCLAGAGGKLRNTVFGVVSVQRRRVVAKQPSSCRYGDACRCIRLRSLSENGGSTEKVVIDLGK